MQDSTSNKRFAIDTTFVLFFLGLDFGQSAWAFTLDSAFWILTIGMVLVVPYFMATIAEKPDFTGWLMGRSLILVFSIILGLMFRQALGTLLPPTFKFLPMSMVIVSAMLSCCLQFYGIIRFRLAR